jgi:hypothetical protein
VGNRAGWCVMTSPITTICRGWRRLNTKYGWVNEKPWQY